MAKMHYHKLSLTICDYEKLISIGRKYNQLEIKWILREARKKLTREVAM